MSSKDDRRRTPRPTQWLARRRYPRVPLDVDWFIESSSTATFGRGLEISPRGVRLPVEVTPLNGRVTLWVALHRRPRLFRARGTVMPTRERVVIQFSEVPPDDMAYLGQALIEAAGIGAIPELNRKFQRFTGLERRFLRTST